MYRRLDAPYQDTIIIAQASLCAGSETHPVLIAAEHLRPLLDLRDDNDIATHIVTPPWYSQVMTHLAKREREIKLEIGYDNVRECQTVKMPTLASICEGDQEESSKFDAEKKVTRLRTN